MLTSLLFTLAVIGTKPSTAPVAIASCKFVRAASFSRGIEVAYKNTSTRTETLVIFNVVRGNSQTLVVDEGTFAPGQSVDHVLTSAPLTLWLGETPDTCAVVHVHFADGTSWSP